MTREEAMALKIGDVVEAKLSGKWVKARVSGDAWIDPNERLEFLATKLKVRRPGVDAGGRPHGSWTKTANEVRLLAYLEPAAANVYADWLEEHGELRAAQKLREAFPLGGEVQT